MDVVRARIKTATASLALNSHLWASLLYRVGLLESIGRSQLADHRRLLDEGRRLLTGPQHLPQLDALLHARQKLNADAEMHVKEVRRGLQKFVCSAWRR